MASLCTATRVLSILHKEFTDYFTDQNVIQSMSHASCTYDNALKSELIYQRSYTSEIKLIFRYR